MGVTGLWSLLKKVKEDVSLSECNGQRIAVDLSGWIVQCSLASNATFNRDGMPPQSYLTNRQVIFFFFVFFFFFFVIVICSFYSVVEGS